MPFFNQIERPTLLINEQQTKKNIHSMVQKANETGIRLRPHFKTHQSAEIAEWFHAEGVQQCTVSSVSMGAYFSQHGWNDITVAFPVNPREIKSIQDLQTQVDKLALLVENPEVVELLDTKLTAPLEVWIKIDCGYHRTGIVWNHTAQLLQLAENIHRSQKLQLRGLLSHFGNTYHETSPQAVREIYQTSLKHLQTAQESLTQAGFTPIELSIGDTPSCSLVADFGNIDEMRPGNFVFYDTTQLMIGSCQPEQISVALACPIVALHPERSEVIIYGGAIHLSKDKHPFGDQPAVYGLPCLPTETGWGAPITESYVKGLSQEHGIVHVEPETLKTLKVGDLLMILPAHSCLTLQAMRSLTTTDGRRIETMLTEGGLQ